MPARQGSGQFGPGRVIRVPVWAERTRESQSGSCELAPACAKYGKAPAPQWGPSLAPAGCTHQARSATPSVQVPN